LASEISLRYSQASTTARANSPAWFGA